MDLEVARAELQTTRRHEGSARPLSDDEVRIQVGSFALTANNITYAVFGDALKYWEFFPAGSPSEAGAGDVAWGRIPVWGFGDVTETTSDSVVVGERLYGYFPMSSELIVRPGRNDERGFTDLAPHRASMAGAYNRYLRVAADPIYRSDREDHQMLLWPLFFTSFVVEDFLVDNDMFGAQQLVISSASSKTAIGTAFQAHSRGDCRVVGLTSGRNAAFVEGLGLYDQVITYDQLEQVAQSDTAYVDIAGDRTLLHALHARLADVLRYSMTVGGTHWDQPSADHGELPGPQPVFFFAPTQIAKRNKDWGPAELDARVGDAWARYSDWADRWVEFVHVSGYDEVVKVYLELLDGQADPRTGIVCSLP
jgi:hypothetical protein